MYSTLTFPIVLGRARALLYRDPGHGSSVWDDPRNMSRRKGVGSLSSGVGCWGSGRGNHVWDIHFVSDPWNQGWRLIFIEVKPEVLSHTFSFAEWICLPLKGYSTNISWQRWFLMFSIGLMNQHWFHALPWNSEQLKQWRKGS